MATPDSPLDLLGPAARALLARKAGERGVTSATLAAEILASQLLAPQPRHEHHRPPAEASRPNEATAVLMSRLVHELRTPVGSLMMLSEMLEAEADDEHCRGAHNARRVRMLAADIVKVLEEISELSALQRGTVHLHPQPISVPSLLAELERDHRSAASEDGTELDVHVDPSSPPVLHTDRECLTKMLERLLLAVMRGGAGGRVEVRVRPCDTPRGPGVSFSFADHGAPLPAGGEVRIFQPFGLADARSRRSHGGSSLALPIAASAAALLGGELAVASSAEETRFTLTMPAAPPASSNGPA
jgi:signal transduction histidine kinase